VVASTAEPQALCVICCVVPLGAAAVFENGTNNVRGELGNSLENVAIHLEMLLFLSLDPAEVKSGHAGRLAYIATLRKWSGKDSCWVVSFVSLDWGKIAPCGHPCDAHHPR
jgi:hypothetical protein